MIAPTRSTVKWRDLWRSSSESRTERSMAAAIKKSILLALALIVIAGPAAADDFETCRHASGDAAIAACTQAIDSKEYSGHALAVLFHNRGIEYGLKADLDRAIADYSEAIRLDPEYSNAFHNRALVYQKRGDLDRAFEDFNEAIRLDPKERAAYINRGIAW